MPRATLSPVGFGIALLLLALVPLMLVRGQETVESTRTPITPEQLAEAGIITVDEAAAVRAGTYFLTEEEIQAAKAAFPEAFAAKDKIPLAEPPSPIEVAEAAGLSSCLDHYRFGSTPAVIDAKRLETLPGTPMEFSGTVLNENAYAVTNADVYVKIFRSRGTEKDVNGPDVVDFFKVAEYGSIAAGESVPLSFMWETPSDAQPGEYQAATFVVSEDRFNLLGLTFTDDIVGHVANFSVRGKDVGAVRFKKDAVTVNGTSYYFAAYPPTVFPAQSVPVVATIENTSGAAYRGAVTWKLYSWDTLRNQNLIDTKEQGVVVEAGATTEIAYDAALSVPSSVYLVTGEFVTEGGSRSYINVRFVLKDTNIPRLNYVGADQGVVFACFHSTGRGPAEDGRLVLTAKRTGIMGLFGNLASVSYEGRVPGELLALTAPLPEIEDGYAVTAELYQDNRLVDTVTVIYDSSFPYLTVGAAVLLCIAILISVYVRRRKTIAPVTITPTP